MFSFSSLSKMSPASRTNPRLRRSKQKKPAEVNAPNTLIVNVIKLYLSLYEITKAFAMVVVEDRVISRRIGPGLLREACDDTGGHYHQENHLPPRIA